MIQSIFVDNYKSLVNFRIRFDQLHVLIGKNGTGKSTVFEVLQKVTEFVLEHHSVIEEFPAVTKTRWQKVDVQTFELNLQTEADNFQYHLEIEHFSDGNARVKKESLQTEGGVLFSSENGKATLYNDSFRAGTELLWDWTYSGLGMVAERKDNKQLVSFKKALGRVIICAPAPQMSLEATGYESKLPDYRFTNVASVFMHLLQRYPGSVEEMRRALKEINSHFEMAYLEDAGKDKTLRLMYSYKDKTFDYGFEELSDGEKLLFILYMISECYLRNGYSVFIDEPDNYLALREIQPWCVAVEERLTGSSGQCIMISHHPEVIDFLAQTNGVWFSRTGGGAVRLLDPPSMREGQAARALTYSEMLLRGEIDETE